jgi:hypothetical protein
MRIYSEYEILSTNEADGLAQVKWYVKGHTEQCIIRVHYIPLECETENWNEKTLINFWRQEVPDVPKIPNYLLRR